jgi:hypothetical protein
MSAFYTTIYNIGPGIDLTTATTSEVYNIFVASLPSDYIIIRDQRLAEEINNGVYVNGDVLVVLDRAIRIMIFHTEYSTLAAAQDRENWANTFRPTVFGEFSHDRSIVTDNIELINRGQFTA